MLGSGCSPTRIMSPIKKDLEKFKAGLKAHRQEKADRKLQLRLHKIRETVEAEQIGAKTDSPVARNTDLAYLIPRRREMADSSHPSDDDPPPVYTADAAQNCLDLGPWMQVQFLDHLNAMTADEFFDAISNMTCFIGGEGYWWEDLNDDRYLMERRQCIAFNLRRWESIENSDKDYLSALSDSFEDARQLWRNKTINMSVELKDRYRLVTVLGADRRKARAMVVAIKRRIEEMEKDLERPFSNNFTDVLNLNRADLVNTYGAVWLSKHGRNRDVMGPAKFVIARTTVSPKASQSDPRIF
jgi:hypothetical protein